MKKLLLILSFIGLVSNIVLCQEKNQKGLKTNSVYYQFLGNTGTFSSLNYDKLFYRSKKYSLHYSIGIGYDTGKRFKINPRYGFPVMFGWSRGTRNHHLDLGLGLLYNSGIVQMKSGFDMNYESYQAIWFPIRIAYKYQRQNGGLFIRTGLTPLILIKEFSSIGNIPFFPMVGIGVGYTF